VFTERVRNLILPVAQSQSRRCAAGLRYDLFACLAEPDPDRIGEADEECAAEGPSAVWLAPHAGRRLKQQARK
jgi:hypothetical protein